MTTNDDVCMVTYHYGGNNSKYSITECTKPFSFEDMMLSNFWLSHFEKVNQMGGVLTSKLYINRTCRNYRFVVKSITNTRLLILY